MDGQTYGIFQFESSGMRDTLRKAKPQVLEDLIALNALYRPGPLQGGMIDDFIARKTGRKKVTYELPQLKDRLTRTVMPGGKAVHMQPMAVDVPGAKGELETHAAERRRPCRTS